MLIIQRVKIYITKNFAAEKRKRAKQKLKGKEITPCVYQNGTQITQKKDY